MILSQNILVPQRQRLLALNCPKLSIPKFNGDVLNWRTFWEQFQVWIENRDQLSDAEKLAYLKDALKDGFAECIIQGLTQIAGTYDKVFKCLLNRYDRPRLIDQAHVRAIWMINP